ncbi:MAG TPA: hypothetical protein PLE43_05190 [Alphaproteobacteria bacterium]|nr:hypothetical protein [Alphaproteobacteria bacterium]
MIKEKNSPVSASNEGGSSEHSPAFQRMMAHITQNTAPIEEVSAEVDHDNTSHVLISNTGQDFFDGKSSIRNAAFQRMMREMGQGEDGSELTAEEKDAEKARKSSYYVASLWRDTMQENLDNLLAAIDPNDDIDRVYDSFHDPEREAYLASVDNDYQNGFRSGSHGGSSGSTGRWVSPSFNLSKSELRGQLASDITEVSHMYAADAGMSPRDLAAVLGGIATIESRFGVAREVRGTKYASSASGAFHYLDGTMRGELKQYGSDPRIAARINKLGINVSDGVDKSEVMALKDDNILAASIKAKDIVAIVKRHPELAKDVDGLVAEVYKQHNMGEAGARAFNRGGIGAVAQIDHRIIGNNPMFFRGTNDSNVVANRYEQFTAKAVSASASHLDTAFAAYNPDKNTKLAAAGSELTAAKDKAGAGVEATVAIAKAHTSSALAAVNKATASAPEPHIS